MRDDHGSRAHAIYAPSAAERWINCPGSIHAQEGIADIPSDAALEGTQCHEAASAVLEGMDFDRATRGLSNEQILLVEEYVSAVQTKFRALRRQDGAAQLIVERRMRAPALHPDFHGTGDALMRSRSAVHVDDLKCGWHPVAVRYPDGRLNSQLGSYLLLALAEFGVSVSRFLFNPEEHGIKRLHLTVHQPRVYDRPELTTVSFAELREFLAVVIAAIDRIEDGDRTRKADPSWCKFCLARGRCPTLKAEANKRALADFDDSVENLPLSEMASILANANWLDAQVKGARESVFRALKVGKEIEGSKLVAKKGRKQWTDWDRAEALAISLGIKRANLYNYQPISPAQFITLIKLDPTANERIEWTNLNKCFETKSSGTTVVPADDPRPEVVIKPGDDFPDDEE